MSVPSPIVVIGAGGTGREVVDIIRAINAVHGDKFNLVGSLDDAPSEVHLSRLQAQGVTNRGTVDEWLAGASPHLYTVAIADPRAREKLANKLELHGHMPATLVHPGATLGSLVSIGEGSTIYAGAQLTTNIKIGRHNLINSNTTIGHDVTLDNFVSVNPAASVSGEVRIQAFALIGAGATILQGRSVGTGALVGARALVTKDVPDKAVVKGVPGRW